jgi:hypothetical protein
MQARLIKHTAPGEPVTMRVPQMFEKALLIIHEGEYYIFNSCVYANGKDGELVNVYWHVPPAQLWEESKTGRSAG